MDKKEEAVFITKSVIEFYFKNGIIKFIFVFVSLIVIFVINIEMGVLTSILLKVKVQQA